jgi:hypothetical protein
MPLRSRSSWFVAAAVSVCAVLGATWLRSTSERQEEARDAGTVAIGDSGLTAPVESRHTPSAGTFIALDMPDKPLQGQRRPDANGRCPSSVHVVINGGCWWKAGEDTRACAKDYFVYQGRCYEPVFPRPRPATSGPTEEARDGG